MDEPIPPKPTSPKLYRYLPPYEGHGSHPVHKIAVKYSCPYCGAIIAVDFVSYLLGKNPTVDCGTCKASHALPPIPCFVAGCEGVYIRCPGEMIATRADDGEWDQVCSDCSVNYPGYAAQRTRCASIYCDVCKGKYPSPQELPDLD